MFAARQVYSLVRKVAGFWDEVASLWLTDALPPGFWGGGVKGGDHVWLHRANSHRVHHEQFSIATYYRLGFDIEGKKPYKDSRPMRFWLIQQQWVKWMLEKAGKNEKPPSCMSTLQNRARILQEWAKLGLKKEKEEEKETKSKTVLDCKSTLRGWTVEDLGTHRKVQSGAGRRLTLQSLNLRFQKSGRSVPGHQTRECGRRLQMTSNSMLHITEPQSCLEISRRDALCMAGHCMGALSSLIGLQCVRYPVPMRCKCLM